MTAENKQSSQISTLDGYPFTGVGGGSQTGRLTAGLGAAGILQEIEGQVTPTATATSGSYYQMVRVPSNVIIKSVEVVQMGFSSTPTFTGDITIAFSDSTIDGTQPSNQVVPSGLTTTTNAYIANPSATTTGLTGTASLFQHSEAIAGLTAGVWTEVTMLNSAAGNTAFSLTGMLQPLWQAAGFTSDPGGMFDIVIYTTSNNAGTAAPVGLRARFITPPG